MEIKICTLTSSLTGGLSSFCEILVMKIIGLFVFLIYFSGSAFAQTFSDEIKTHREKYKQEFLDDCSSPLKKDDISFLRFFEADEA